MSQEEVVPEHPTSNEATIVNRYSIDVVMQCFVIQVLVILVESSSPNYSKPPTIVESFVGHKSVSVRVCHASVPVRVDHKVPQSQALAQDRDSYRNAKRKHE